MAVPTRGVERWLTQTLSDCLGATPGRTDGIVANVAFPSPRQLIDDAVAAACEIDRADDPWSPERTLWPLLDIVDAALDEPWLAVLASHLRDAAPRNDAALRRLPAVRHLAVLFDRYALHRPQMLAAWQSGSDVDGAGRPLHEPVAWQAELWRRLRERVDAPGPAERIATAERRLIADRGVADLPDRFAVFGLTRLPPAHVRLLRALAAHRDVHLYVLHPSPGLWEQIAPAVDTLLSTRRADDPTVELPRNRLLASWGRDVRELQLVLGDEAEHHLEPPLLEAAPATLLARIQQDIRDDRRTPGPPGPGITDDRPLHTPSDRTIEMHACHGRARQVEVLRDAILHALVDDPTLEPRDVIVMCPDIEAFAPLIHATFGVEPTRDPGTPGDIPDLRVRLADRALRQTNPVLGAIGRLLELAGERMTSSQVLDLADRAPVRRRFAFDDNAIARLQEWVANTEIRWGLDAAHRAPFRLDVVTQNTWQFGVDRVLTGVTLAEHANALVGDVLPYDDVDSGSIDLAGRFAEFVARLQRAVDRLSAPMPMDGWARAIGDAADLLTATTPRDVWQRTQLDRMLSTLAEQSGGAALTLAEVRALLDEQLAGRPSRANFRTGHLTFCTLNPMRSVPHRVVCLLGLDDAAFPRKAPRDGDDLIFDDPHLGDHDARSEDRQLLLDAVMAATDKLVITYTGNDERTNVAMPPAVPVGELLDVIDRTVRCEDGAPRDVVVVSHPLQPFDTRNFTDGTLLAEGPFAFDPLALDGARALRGPRTRPGRFLDAELAPLDAQVIQLDDLVRFVEHPVKAFLRRRLGISLGDYSEDLDERLPIELDALQQWAVGERLLHALLAGQDEDAALQAERARGSLPVGTLAAKTLADVATVVHPLVAAARSLFGGPPGRSSLDVRVELSDGRIVSGTVPGLQGDCVQSVSYSRVAPKHRLAAWVRLLALAASRRDRSFSAITVGRVRRTGGNWRADITVAQIDAVPDARASLERLVDLYDRGMREPLPLPSQTAAAYAALRHTGRPLNDSVKKCWESDFNYDREDKEGEHVLVRGGVASFDDILAESPRGDELWHPDEDSRLGQLALRLWSDLLDSEEVTDR